MLLTRYILLILLLQLSTGTVAQVTEREGYTSNRPTTRDTNAELKKKIIHHFDSLINSCNTQILLLNQSIDDEYEQIEVVKKHSKQAEADYAAWEKNPPRYQSDQQLYYQLKKKHQDLEKMLKINNYKIDAMLKNIKGKKNEIKILQFEISKLEKDKAVTLKKLQ